MSTAARKARKRAGVKFYHESKGNPTPAALLARKHDRLVRKVEVVPPLPLLARISLRLRSMFRRTR